MGAEEYSNPLAPTRQQQDGAHSSLSPSLLGGQQQHGPSPTALSESTLDPAGVIHLIRTLVDSDGRFSLAGYTSPTSPSRPREEAGEVLWDMTAVAEHASFLTAHLLPEALGALLSNPETPDRLLEIAFGSLANLFCHPAGVARLGDDAGIAHAAARVLFNSRDPPTLIEACRCFSVAARPNRGARAWRGAALGDDAFAARVVLIAAVTARSDLLEGALNCLTALAMVGEVVPSSSSGGGAEAGAGSGALTPSPAVTPQRAVGAAGGVAPPPLSALTSSGCGAICRAGGVQLVSTATNPDASEATPGVVDAALRLLEALMMVGDSIEDVYDHIPGGGGGGRGVTVVAGGASPVAAAAAADAADAAEARREVCYSGALRENLVRLLGGGGGGNHWAEEAEEVRDGATLALAQLAGEAEEGSGAVGLALLVHPAALERLIHRSCSCSSAPGGSRGEGGGEEDDDEEEESRSEMRQAALYLLGAVCGVLEGRLGPPRVWMQPPLSDNQRTEALARLTSAVLRGAERGGIGTWGGGGDDSGVAGGGGGGGGARSEHHDAAVNAVISAVCRAAVAWERTCGAGPLAALSEAGAAVRGFIAHLELSSG